MVHRRLAVIDLSERGAQPMRDDTLGLRVVFNGCIYNHHELRGELCAAAVEMNRSGLNRGTSGNLSVRSGDSTTLRSAAGIGSP